MHSHEVRIDVTGRVDLPGSLETAATVHLPDPLDRPATVIFGYPGGSYGRAYYDIRRLPGYSQAEHHAADGYIFVACDHLGIGGSTPIDPFDLTLERMAAANHATATTLIEQLQAGGLIGGVGPVEVAKVVGIGQSMGGCLLVVQQGLHRTFDGIAVLGYGLRSSFPTPDHNRLAFPAPPRKADLRAGADQVLGTIARTVDLVYAFHAAEEEPALVEADLRGPVDDDRNRPPWKVGLVPPCAASMMGEGAVATEAELIDVPVLIGGGEIDLVTDPWTEPAWYHHSYDVAIFVVPRMAHMHNFAPTRELLWRRITRFTEDLTTT